MAACGKSCEDSLDLQVVEDAVQLAPVLLGNASTQFSVYRRTKVLADFSKELISFAEEPELRGAAPQLFGSAFTKQVADHLEQVETPCKAKGKTKTDFFEASLQMQVRWQRGADLTAVQGLGNISSSRELRVNSKEIEMTIKDGASHVHVSSLGIKSQSYISRTACYGVCHRSTTTKQSSSGRRALCRELESSHCRPVGTEYCSRVSDSILGGTKTGSGSSSLSVPRRPANPTARIVSLTGKQRGYQSPGTYYAAGFYSTVFLAPKKEGWWRPVINLKALNLNS